VVIDTAWSTKHKRKKRFKKHHMYLKSKCGINDFMHLGVTSGQFIYMSFESYVVVTRFNRRKERVNTMTGISHNKSMSAYAL